MEDEYIVRKMQELSSLIKYEPSDISFLKEAMHRQIIHKPNDGKNRRNYTNDAYATLGDIILKLVLAEYLFDKGYDKKEITQKKQDIENNSELFGICNTIGIFKFAYNDKYFFGDAPLGNKVSNSKHNPYIEAIIAAIYKDKGFDYCKKWIYTFFKL